MTTPTIDLSPLRADPYWPRITEMAAINNVDLAVIEEEIVRTYANPVLNVIEAGLPRMLQAAGIVLARNSRDIIVKVEPFTLRVLAITAPHVITKKDKSKMRLATILGFAQSAKPGAKMALANVTFYEKAADLVEGAVEGQVYKLDLSGGFKDGQYKLTGDRRSAFGKPVEVPPGDIWATPTPDLIGRLYPRVMANQLHTRVGKTAMVMGRVVMANTPSKKPEKGGGNFGKYTLIDDSLSTGDISKGGSVQVMCNAEQVKYGEGSTIIVIGQVTKHEQYGLSVGGFNVVIVPVLAFPRVEKGEEAAAADGKPPVDFSEYKDPDEEDGTAPPQVAAPASPPSQPSTDEFA